MFNMISERLLRFGVTFIAKSVKPFSYVPVDKAKIPVTL